MKKRVYISGPISGLSREYYMRIFAEKEMQLKMCRRCEVVNPTRLWICRLAWVYPLLVMIVGGRNAYRMTLAYDLWKLWHCTHIVLLAGCEASRGARLERWKAREWGISELKS